MVEWWSQKKADVGEGRPQGGHHTISLHAETTSSTPALDTFDMVAL